MNEFSFTTSSFYCICLCNTWKNTGAWGNEGTDSMTKSYYGFPRTKCQQWFLEYCLKGVFLISWRAGRGNNCYILLGIWHKVEGNLHFDLKILVIKGLGFLTYNSQAYLHKNKKLQARWNELESSCKVLNLIAEAVHTSHLFPQRGGLLVDKTRPPEVL